MLHVASVTFYAHDNISFPRATVGIALPVAVDNISIPRDITLLFDHITHGCSG